jgi:predicted TIM-barrel fold metal-dependent hydrolase
MELPSSDNIYALKVDEFDTSQLLTNASRQRDERGLQDVFIVDADSHHYETEAVGELLDYIPDPVMKQLSMSALGVARKSRGFPYSRVGYQDLGGRITREPLRGLEETSADGGHRDVQLALKRMDSMGVDVAVLLPTPMMLMGMHPQIEFEVQIAQAYNRWLVEKVLSGSDRLKSFAYLPFNDPEATYRMVQEFKDEPGIVGFLVTSVRQNAVHENVYAKTYAAIQDAGKVLSFHTGYDWDDPTFGSPSRFVAVQAIGYPFYNVVHCVNWLCNGMQERFPELNVLWMEGGLAWVLWVMQRIDSEYRMRSSECPGLKKLPSHYMRDMYFTSQPLENGNSKLLESTFKAMDAGDQVLYASNYPLPDMDVPSVIWDLDFLDEQQKRNILGENARKLFKL